LIRWGKGRRWARCFGSSPSELGRASDAGARHGGAKPRGSGGVVGSLSEEGDREEWVAWAKWLGGPGTLGRSGYGKILKSEETSWVVGPDGLNSNTK
jgi:hypothetical protein